MGDNIGRYAAGSITSCRTCSLFCFSLVGLPSAFHVLHEKVEPFPCLKIYRRKAFYEPIVSIYWDGMAEFYSSWTEGEREKKVRIIASSLEMAKFFSCLKQLRTCTHLKRYLLYTSSIAWFGIYFYFFSFSSFVLLFYSRVWCSGRRASRRPPLGSWNTVTGGSWLHGAMAILVIVISAQA